MKVNSYFGVAWGLVITEFRWLAGIIRDDVIQECRLLEYEAQTQHIVTEYTRRNGVRQAVKYNTLEYEEFVKLARLRLRHVCQDYELRPGTQEKRVYGVDVYNMLEYGGVKVHEELRF